MPQSSTRVLLIAAWLYLGIQSFRPENQDLVNEEDGTALATLAQSRAIPVVTDSARAAWMDTLVESALKCAEDNQHQVTIASFSQGGEIKETHTEHSGEAKAKVARGKVQFLVDHSYDTDKLCT